MFQLYKRLQDWRTEFLTLPEVAWQVCYAHAFQQHLRTKKFSELGFWIDTRNTQRYYGQGYEVQPFVVCAGNEAHGPDMIPMYNLMLYGTNGKYGEMLFIGDDEFEGFNLDKLEREYANRKT